MAPHPTQDAGIDDCKRPTDSSSDLGGALPPSYDAVRRRHRSADSCLPCLPALARLRLAKRWNRCRCSLTLFAVFGLLPLAVQSKDITLGFDGLADLASNIDSQGARLTGATVLACGASLNCSQFPPFSGRNVIYDGPSSGGTITVTFDSAITGMVHSVSARITGNTNITMTAYGKDNAVLGTASTGGPNYASVGTPNMLLTIPSPTAAIARVVVHDTGNTFTIDDFMFSATPSVTLLDPGHGLLLGSDGKWHYQRPASPTYSLREDLLTLSIAAAARDQLVNDDREVYMTRSGARALYTQPCGTLGADDTIDYCNDDLKLRVALAKKLKLDEKNDVTFVSVHTNGGSRRSIRGRTQTFYCMNEAKLLAEKLLAAIWTIAPANFSLSTGGYVDCDMAVLAKTAADRIPASLIEVLYHTDSDDEDLLIDDVFLTNAGKGIASAIEGFIDEKAAAK